MTTAKKEKVYITKDEGSNTIWVWRKPTRGVWPPKKLKDCETVNWQREDNSLENADSYIASDFKKKFGTVIKCKTKKCIHLSVDLLNNEDYKLISNDADRKQ